MTQTPIIELREVSLEFTDSGSHRVIIKNANLSLFSNDSLVVVGPSGYGKSSLLKIMSLLIEPSSGQVLWNGHSVKEMTPEDQRTQLIKMGMLFQKNALFDSMTSAENIAFPLRETTKLSEMEITERVNHYLEAVQLAGSRDLFPNQMSGGMQKRLGIARALALEPRVIFYDDPTAGLDPITSRRISQLIMDLKTRMKSTIVTVTNDMNRAFQMAGRFVFIMEKELVETGGPFETKSFPDARIQQFIKGETVGPIWGQ